MEKEEKMKNLVTGATGFVGSHIAKKLKDKDIAKSAT